MWSDESLGGRKFDPIPPGTVRNVDLLEQVFKIIRSNGSRIAFEGSPIGLFS